MPDHRGWTWLIGSQVDTLSRARALLSPDLQVLWVGGPGLSPRELRRALGTTVDAVVVDTYRGLDPDVVAQAQGFIRGGGRLIGMGPETPVASRLTQVTDGPLGTTRLHARLTRTLGPGTLDPVVATSHTCGPTTEQDAVVQALVEGWQGPPRADVLLAERGRGKSVALGRALERFGTEQVALSAPDRQSVRGLLDFAGATPPTWVPVHQLPWTGPWRLIVIDEAAGVSVPLLQAIATAHPDAHLALATTTAGYEGTGRGFVLRFLEWLDQQPRPAVRHTLTQPMRWGPDDPLEARIRRALLLDATLAPADRDQPVHAVARHASALPERQLSELMGLLVHAHYRTTPADLLRLLDAPNLRLHLLLQGDHVVGANVLAIEGGLSQERCDQAAAGRLRLRGHALPDTLMTQAGVLEAGALRWVRSVRIVVHPALRRTGAGAALAAHTHASHQPDGFGTLFGATPAVLRFRRAQGYHLVRVSSGRSARSGEPSAVMVRPVSDAARAIVDALQPALARDLPLQLRALRNQGPLPDALAHALAEHLPAPTAWDRHELSQVVLGYVHGPQTADHVLGALHTWLPTRDLGVLHHAERTLIEARVARLEPWEMCADQAGYNSVRAAQRALRRVVAKLL
jgi:tRNA(Met) cytidine acetyltransferase